MEIKNSEKKKKQKSKRNINGKRSKLTKMDFI